MTIGTKTSGNISGDKYSSKSWSGADGQYEPSGETKVNPYEMFALNRSRTKGKRAITFFQGKWLCSNAVSGYFFNCEVLTADPWTANKEIALLGKLSEEVRSHDFHLGIALGTGKMAYNQAVSTVTAIGKALVNLRRLKIAEAMRCVGLVPGQRSVKHIKGKMDQGDISGAWLAMSYGWLPTLHDSYQAWKAYEALTAPPRKATIVVSKSGVSPSYDGSLSPALYSCESRRVTRVRLAYTLKEELSVPRSLGLYDPASVAWELMPWSFAIDWFIPIGAYLGALSVIPTLNGSWVRTSKSYHTGNLGVVKAPEYLACGSPGGVQYSSITLKRTKGTELSVPFPAFVPLGAVMSPLRLANAISLAHQQLLKFRK